MDLSFLNPITINEPKRNNFDTKNLSDLVHKSVIHISNNSFGEANRCLHESLKINPYESMIYNNLGVIYENTNDLKLACKYYLTALTLNKKIILFRNNFNRTLHKSGISQIKTNYLSIIMVILLSILGFILSLAGILILAFSGGFNLLIYNLFVILPLILLNRHLLKSKSFCPYCNTKLRFLSKEKKVIACNNCKREMEISGDYLILR